MQHEKVSKRFWPSSQTTDIKPCATRRDFFLHEVGNNEGTFRGYRKLVCRGGRNQETWIRETRNEQSSGPKRWLWYQRPFGGGRITGKTRILYVQYSRHSAPIGNTFFPKKLPSLPTELFTNFIVSVIIRCTSVTNFFKSIKISPCANGSLMRVTYRRCVQSSHHMKVSSYIRRLGIAEIQFLRISLFTSAVTSRQTVLWRHSLRSIIYNGRGLYLKCHYGNVRPHVACIWQIWPSDIYLIN